MWEKLQGLESRYEELARMMADQAMTSDRARLTEMAQEHRELEATVTIDRRRDTGRVRRRGAGICKGE